MRKKTDIFFPIMFCLFLGACSAYVDERREAGHISTIGQSTSKKIAVCYNPLFSDETNLQQIAQEKCASKKAVLSNYKYFNCTLFYPNTVFYTCE